MKWFDIVISVLTVMVLAISIWTIGPMLETKFFPVYSKFKIVELAENERGNSVVVAEYHKYRECPPIGVAWFLNPTPTSGTLMRQLTVTNRPVSGVLNIPSNPVGKHLSLPFELDAKPTDVLNYGVAVVYSQCHPLWTTRSEIFP